MDTKNLGFRGLVASDLPVSEVIGTLTKRVYNSEIHKPEYEYMLTKIFGKESVFDGLKDVNYTEYVTTDAGNPYEAVKISDFNASTNKVLRETVEADKQSNVKTEILDSILMNFNANPMDAVATAFSNTENISKQQEIFHEKLLWETILNGNVVEIDTTDDTKDVDSAKTMYETLLDYQTTSKVHAGVGTNGVITIKSNTIQPAKKFDTTEFYVIESNKFKTNIVFDGERSYFNWGGSKLEVAGRMSVNLDKYEGMADAEKAKLAGFKSIFIHKDTALTVMDWQGTGIANAGKLFSVITNYLKIGVYKRLDKPVVIFRDVPVPSRKA